MDYDFSGLCADQLEKLRKRLEGFNKSIIKEYQMALNIINDAQTNDNRSEINVEVQDLLRDQVSKCQIFYTETMNKVQRALSKYL